MEPSLEPLGGDRVHVALAHHDVDLAVDLDLGLVLGVEEDPVADLDGPGVRADRDHPRPGQPARAHRRGGGDDDAAAGTALAGLLVDLDEDPVVQHLDRGGLGVTASGRPLLARSVDDLADEGERSDDPDDRTGRLEDVVGARRARVGVDEVRLDARRPRGRRWSWGGRGRRAGRSWRRAARGSPRSRARAAGSVVVPRVLLGSRVGQGSSEGTGRTDRAGSKPNGQLEPVGRHQRVVGEHVAGRPVGDDHPVGEHDATAGTARGRRAGRG